MISIFDLEERARAWSLDERIVEKDWVIGWILWGIGTESDLDGTWIFKGGTCLKKCYIETYRFSEDLDFTVLPGGPIEVDEVAVRLRSVLARVAEESGINLLGREPLVKQRGEGSVEGRIYYRALRGQQTEFSVKLDLLATEIVVAAIDRRRCSPSYHRSQATTRRATPPPPHREGERMLRHNHQLQTQIDRALAAL